MASNDHVRQRCVLVVSANDDARTAIDQRLRDSGYEVIASATAHAALDVLLGDACPELALIVLDLDIPIVGATDLIDTMRTFQHLEGIPILLFGDENPARHGNLSPTIEFLTRPADSRALAELVVATALLNVR